jgi:hypothetical protein
MQGTLTRIAAASLAAAAVSATVALSSAASNQAAAAPPTCPFVIDVVQCENMVDAQLSRATTPVDDSTAAVDEPVATETDIVDRYPYPERCRVDNFDPENPLGTSQVCAWAYGRNTYFRGTAAAFTEYSNHRFNHKIFNQIYNKDPGKIEEYECSKTKARCFYRQVGYGPGYADLNHASTASKAYCRNDQQYTERVECVYRAG